MSDNIDDHGMLEEAMKELDLTQGKLSKLSGCSQASVSKMINGLRVASSIQRDVCRLGLMPHAARLGYPEDKVWDFGEHVIFGMTMPRKAFVLKQVYEHADISPPADSCIYESTEKVGVSNG